MNATQARIAVAEWIALARSRRAAAVAALGATGMPALSLSMLDEAMRADDDGGAAGAAGRDLEIVEVAEWTSVDDVNAALGSGSAVVLAAGYRDGAVHFAVGRFRATEPVAS